MTLKQFLTMGGYAYYVWPAYLMALVVLGGNLLYSRRQRKSTLRNVKRWLRWENDGA